MVLNQEQFDAFRMEIATFGNIPILSQYCGIGCVFCKVHTDSYLGHYPKIPMIDKEDLIKGFAFINPNVNYVRLGAVYWSHLIQTHFFILRYMILSKLHRNISRQKDNNRYYRCIYQKTNWISLILFRILV